jgi:hypothetical protein
LRAGASLARASLIAALLLGAALTPAPAKAQASEDAVKAAFLPRFVRYVVWPPLALPAANTPFRLCLVGRDPFGRMLDQAAGSEQIDGHTVVVRRISNAAQLAGCHLAFIRGQTPDETARLLLAARRHSVLTITDSRAGPQRGMIHFAVVGGRVRFFIDEAAAAERGLAISSRLLALAAGVRQRR